MFSLTDCLKNPDMTIARHPAEVIIMIIGPERKLPETIVNWSSLTETILSNKA